MATDQPHRHGHVHLDEADWEHLAADAERDGELFLSFLIDTMGWVTRLRGGDAPPVRRVLDIGSGPGVGTVALARAFPHAHVIAVDSSPAMLDRARQRATQADVDDRISFCLAELPGGVDGLQPAEVIWASMSLHHVGDEVAALRVLHDLLAPTGLIAIAELAEPTQVLPDDLDVGRPGLADRLERAMGDWFASMRDGLADTAPSADLETMLTSAGLQSVGSRFIRERLDAPLSPEARRVALGHVRRTRHQLDDRLDQDDLDTLAVLSDLDDPRGVIQRPDARLVSSRQIHIARRMPPL